MKKEEVKKEKTGKGKNIVIIILVVTIVLLLAFIYYILFYKNNKPTNNNPEVKTGENNNTDKKTAFKKEDSTNYHYVMTVHYDEDEKEFCYSSDPEDCGNNKINIKTETKDAKKIDVYSDRYVFYSDNGKIKYYDETKKESYVINIPGNYYNYNFYVDYYTDELLGIIYRETEDGFPSFYSFELNKVLYNKEYRDLYLITKDYLYSEDSECAESPDEYGYYECEQTKIHLLSAKEEKELLSDVPKKDSDGYFEDIAYGVLENEKGTYIFEGSFMDSYVYDKIYNNDLKVIVKNTNEYECDIGTDGNLYLAKKGVVSVYDKTGKVIKTSKKYDIQFIVGEYIIAFKNNNLIIATVDGKEIKLTSWNKKKMYLHGALSGWHEVNGKHGIYIVVEDSSANKNDVWESCQKYGCDVETKSELNEIDLGYEYYYIPETGETGRIATTIGGYGKPVLYLYPTQETEVTVTFDKPENLTTTYPKYNDSWKVTVQPNGDIYDSNNKYYYGLYWEERKNHEIDFSEGFYVDGENAIEFLEEKLSYLGLNDRERNEFIMYWLPILEKNEHSLVYFEQTKERNQYSKINITPTPDSILRISIHVKKVNGKVNIKEQKLNHFNRVGFTAVEWGGVIH